MKTFWNNITKENAVFSLLLGLCPALAVTTSFEKAYLMGLSVLFVLLGSALIISLVRKLVPDLVKIPVFILIIGTFVTILEIVLKNEIPNLYKALSIYLPLITVNCIVFGATMEVFAKEKVFQSLLVALGRGIGFTFALIILGFFRELLGSNSLTIISSEGLANLVGMNLKIEDIIPGMQNLKLFLEPAGAFLVLALLLAFINYLKFRRAKNGSN